MSAVLLSSRGGGRETKVYLTAPPGLVWLTNFSRLQEGESPVAVTHTGDSNPPIYILYTTGSTQFPLMWAPHSSSLSLSYAPSFLPPRPLFSSTKKIIVLFPHSILRSVLLLAHLLARRSIPKQALKSTLLYYYRLPIPFHRCSKAGIHCHRAPWFRRRASTRNITRQGPPLLCRWMDSIGWGKIRLARLRDRGDT